MDVTEQFIIRVGCDYFYTADHPAGCKGHLYRVHRLVLDVPSYQKKVLVECLTGKDKGLWFVCSEANFASRYKLIQASMPGRAKESVVLMPERTAGPKDTEGDKLKGLIL